MNGFCNERAYKWFLQHLDCAVICRNERQVSEFLEIIGLYGDNRYDNAYQYAGAGFVYFVPDKSCYSGKYNICFGSAGLYDNRVRKERPVRFEFPEFRDDIEGEIPSLMEILGGI